MRKLFIFAFIAALTVAFFAGCQTPPPPIVQETELSAEETAAKQKDVGVVVEVVNENGSSTVGTMNGGSTVVAGSSPQYVVYNADKYADLKGAKPFVLFFHANWCPICKRMEEDIKADLDTYPQGTVILQTDYDTETDLKREYRINIQSTFIVFDSEGNEIYRAADPLLDDFKAAVTRSLEIS